jgi:hypothetical protein
MRQGSFSLKPKLLEGGVNMSVNRRGSKKVEEINELDLRYIAEYSGMSKADLIDYIEAQLTPRSQTAGWIETSHFVGELFQSLRSNFVNEAVAETRSPQYPQLFKSGYSKDYFSDLQKVLCKDNWLCDLLGEDVDKNTPEQVVQIIEVIMEVTNQSRWQHRVSPYAVAVLLTKLGAKEFCNCTVESTSSSEND